MVTAADVAVLAGVSTAWESFALHLGEIGPDGACALARAPWLHDLRALSLPTQRLGDRGAAELIQALDGGPIQELRLPHGDLGAAAAHALATASLPSLRVLELSYNDLDDAALGRLLANSSLGSLTHIHLLGTGAGPRAISALAPRSALRCIELGDAVGDAAAAELARCGFPNLDRLQRRGVSDDAMRAFEGFGGYVTNARFA